MSGCSGGWGTPGPPSGLITECCCVAALFLFINSAKCPLGFPARACPEILQVVRVPVFSASQQLSEEDGDGRAVPAQKPRPSPAVRCKGPHSRKWQLGQTWREPGSPGSHLPPPHPAHHLLLLWSGPTDTLHLCGESLTVWFLSGTCWTECA